MRRLLPALIVIVSLGSFAATAATAAQPEAGVRQYDFLRGSKWYVPPSTLPAMEMDLSNGRVRALLDQTVWEITNYRYGYFWGRTVAVFKYAATGQPIGAPGCSRMVGSVTPDGRVHITFIPQGQQTMSLATTGTGTLSGNANRRLFQMQMSTGTTSVIAHWSYMAQCKPGDQCESRLPGTKQSLEQFLAQCD
jgi:hypothetical protein